jgi:hypothetical protein
MDPDGALITVIKKDFNPVGPKASQFFNGHLSPSAQKIRTSSLLTVPVVKKEGNPVAAKDSQFFNGQWRN